MNKPLLIGIGLIILVFLGAGAVWLRWGHAPAAPAEQQATSTPVGVMYEAGNVLLGTDAASSTGTYLIGFNGRPVYTYSRDTTGVSNCSGACASAWPSYLVRDTSALGNLKSGVNGEAGTITRADGSLQVTYNGMPLYFYASDSDTSGPMGDGVGGVWKVAKPGMMPTPAGATSAAIGERIVMNGVAITPLTLVSDSRCPVDVQCIQAGTVSITAKLEGAAGAKTVTLSIGKAVAYGSAEVTLMTVGPAKHSKTTLAPSDYRFTFSVTGSAAAAVPQ